MIRAALFDGPGYPFRIQAMPRPTLTEGEALVRISLCTICSSDLHTVMGRRDGPTPCVLGHEAVGILEEFSGDLVDLNGERLSVGDRVVWSLAISCGSCHFCTSGLPQKCVLLQKYGHEKASSEKGPLGGLASHCHLLRGTAIVKVPSELPNRVAAAASCATATVAAALRVGGCRGRQTMVPYTVVILGLGLLGLTASAWVASQGGTVVVCDPDERRLQLASQFGAAALAKPESLHETLHDLTAGRGADLVLEVSGSPQAAELALKIVRVGGTVVWVGSVFPTPAIPVSPEEIVRRCLTLTGIHNYAPNDLVAAVAFLATQHNRYPFADLVERTFALDRVDEAFEYAERNRPFRVALDSA